jgi:hypothetical protein
MQNFTRTSNRLALHGYNGSAAHLYGRNTKKSKTNKLHKIQKHLLLSTSILYAQPISAILVLPSANLSLFRPVSPGSCGSKVLILRFVAYPLKNLQVINLRPVPSPLFRNVFLLIRHCLATTSHCQYWQLESLQNSLATPPKQTA